MFTISKRIEIAGSHRLSLPYPSKCSGVHGHNWIVTVHCRAENLNAEGMVVDFAAIKKMLSDKMDHQDLNERFPGMNPTSENIARWIVNNVPCCYRADVQESEGNTATYEL